MMNNESIMMLHFNSTFKHDIKKFIDQTNVASSLALFDKTERTNLKF